MGSHFAQLAVEQPLEKFVIQDFILVVIQFDVRGIQGPVPVLFFPFRPGPEIVHALEQAVHSPVLQPERLLFKFLEFFPELFIALLEIPECPAEIGFLELPDFVVADIVLEFVAVHDG